jgi:hypothetical protein
MNKIYADEKKGEKKGGDFFLETVGKRSLSEVQAFVRSEQDITFAARLQEWCLLQSP